MIGRSEVDLESVLLLSSYSVEIVINHIHVVNIIPLHVVIVNWLICATCSEIAYLI